MSYPSIIILIVIIAVAAIYMHNKKRNLNSHTHLPDSPSPDFFYSINNGNQHELIYAPNYNQQFFDEIDQKYSWDNYDAYDNIFWEYMYGLHDPLFEIAYDRSSIEEFYLNLTRPQKVFYTFLLFNGDTDNGGVSQFFFNSPEFAFAVLEVFEELKLTKLKQDYEKCLNEFVGTSDSYIKRKEVFNDPKINWEKRWKAFTDGYSDIPSSEIIEDYYYDDNFKKKLFKTFVDYIDNNISQFIKNNPCSL